MRRGKETAGGARGARVIVALTTAGLAAAAAIVWGGMSAVATVSAVNAGPRVSQVPPAAQPAEAPTGARPGPSATTDATKGATKDPTNGATGAGNAPKLGPIPPVSAGPKASKSAGDSPEVSLAEAARTEAGAAASLPEGGNSMGLKQRGPVDPAAVLTDASLSLGGCLPQYGSDGQCLPAIPPSMSRHLKEMKDAGLDPGSMPHSWTCTEVRTYFKSGLSVRKAHVDPQKLDTNHDGVACGAAD
ncbi:hypothetical protein [Arthrobacter sp. ok362]|uniref:hypothetical protein n=1 Tax=Arthrobacter sp. ok362 TaxID=1761745 RepID=UPI00087F00C4|nr:hypothetical protein [Arthrobacter sp. ok362]SDK98103.1 hypothetical protein SAMN04487913_104325 [Arthrobacter sp. ok362]